MTFSIILPTRERIDLLRGLLCSIQRTTLHKDEIEVLIIYDEDDAATDAISGDLPGQFPEFSVRMFKTKRSVNFSRDYYNRLAKEAQGRYLIALNDDAEFVTHDWDQLAIEAIGRFRNHHPDEIFYGWINDNIRERIQGACCFPMLSRPAVDVLGYFFNESFNTWGADIWLYTLFEKARRIVRLPMQINHISYHSGLRSRDQVSCRVEAINNNGDVNPTGEHIKKILRAIGK